MTRIVRVRRHTRQRGVVRVVEHHRSGIARRSRKKINAIASWSKGSPRQRLIFLKKHYPDMRVSVLREWSKEPWYSLPNHVAEHLYSITDGNANRKVRQQPRPTFDIAEWKQKQKEKSLKKLYQSLDPRQAKPLSTFLKKEGYEKIKDKKIFLSPDQTMALGSFKNIACLIAPQVTHKSYKLIGMTHDAENLVFREVGQKNGNVLIDPEKYGEARRIVGKDFTMHAFAPDSPLFLRRGNFAVAVAPRIVEGEKINVVPIKQR